MPVYHYSHFLPQHVYTTPVTLRRILENKAKFENLLPAWFVDWLLVTSNVISDKPILLT